jgi:hypothetical protein
MTVNQYDFDNEDDTDYSGTDLVKQLRKQIKELSLENKELRESYEEVQSYVKEAVVSSVLEEYGLNPKIAAFIPDEYANDEESIVTWLEEYGSLFGANTDIEEDGEEAEGYDTDFADSVNRLNDFEQADIDPSVGQDLYNRIENAGSLDELMRTLKGN